MNAKLPITVTIITRNEESRIEAAIFSVLPFASEIVIVDSESTDQTVAKSRALGAKVVLKPFAGFGQQKNFAQSLATSEWVLNLDADERVSPELETELRDFFESGASQKIDGVFLPRKTWYLDRWVMHGGWYPNYLLRLSRKSKSLWTEPALHEALETGGSTAHFKHAIHHYSFPNQQSHILKNADYAARAMQALKKKGRRAGVIDFTLRPIWKFFDGYFLKAGFLDGRTGFFIAIHSAYATFLRYTYLYEETSQDSNSR
ncbi:MAG: glycosyltransferase family 2 protein [Bdellovibrionales bacterium]|nr:glycosyltransferase family 2 protein [Oligoflexia bacterium]